MNTAQVIPFKFDAREVRTMLIDDQPWFVAADVAAALGYPAAPQMTRNLDEDEKGMQNVHTLGGDQEMLVINESGLYSAILRSRKAEAKRFKKWVTAEVLPAIRKHGRYEDSHNKMATLVDELIGMTEVNVIKGLIRDKAKVVPIDRRRGFQLAMHNRLHTRFNVPRVELIPAAQFESACNFIASYALEGEWLPKKEKEPGTFVLDEYQAQFVHNLIHYTHWVCFRWDQGIGVAVKALNPKFHAKTWEFFRESKVCAEMLESALPELVAHFRSRGGLRPHDGITTGYPVGHPAD
ncbi:BRO-N domain-containing protein [Pseudomonas aeruginosa]